MDFHIQIIASISLRAVLYKNYGNITFRGLSNTNICKYNTIVLPNINNANITQLLFSNTNYDKYTSWSFIQHFMDMKITVITTIHGLLYTNYGKYNTSQTFILILWQV